MAKIELARMVAARHTVKLPLKFEGNGAGDKTTTEQISIVYRGVSLIEADEFAEKLQTSNDRRQTMIDQLAATVVELPDIVDNGAPVTPTPEFFQTLDTYFLFRIGQAIIDDRQGNA
jgi:hypothetical protein